MPALKPGLPGGPPLRRGDELITALHGLVNTCYLADGLIALSSHAVKLRRPRRAGIKLVAIAWVLLLGSLSRLPALATLNPGLFRVYSFVWRLFLMGGANL